MAQTTKGPTHKQQKALLARKAKLLRNSQLVQEICTDYLKMFSLSRVKTVEDLYNYYEKAYDAIEVPLKLPAPATHTTEEGIETPGTLITILPYKKHEERGYCIFLPDEGPKLQVFLDEVKIIKR